MVCGIKDHQIAVVAGTAPETSRVAYVKTVRPEAETGDDNFEDTSIRHQARRGDQYCNIGETADQFNPGVSRTVTLNLFLLLLLSAKRSESGLTFDG